MTKERGGSLIFLAAGIYGMVFSIGLPFGRWNEPGPGVFPLALSILLCISGIVWFIRGKTTGETRRSAGWKEFSRKYVTAAQIVGLTGVFILVLEPLGYLLTSILYLFVLLLWVCRYKLWVAAVFAMTFGAGSWFFFEKLLTTPLPKGFLPF
jgi:putative tricarboxylic transport membrane protein